MGTADLVPGVSGGTVALVLGIYAHLVATIREGAGALASLLRGDGRVAVGRARAVDWRFLLPLLAGILLAVVVLAGPLGTLLDERPVEMSGLFTGLIVGSIFVTLPDVERWDAVRIAAFTSVAIIAAIGLGARSGSISSASYLVLFGAGAVAICAMILPGISGSFILLMLGLYDHVLDLAHARDVVPLLIFAVGAATGLGLFSTGLSWLLERHRDTILAALIGLMAGSLRVLWPWPAAGGVGDTRLAAPGDAAVAAVLLALVGALVVLALGRWGRAVEDDGADRGRSERAS